MRLVLIHVISRVSGPVMRIVTTINIGLLLRLFQIVDVWAQRFAFAFSLFAHTGERSGTELVPPATKVGQV
ncbi:hypothetical protein [Yoonia litorea]|uniref:Uncharacterized protein n=1 Tax=Yoonia litorea TaxID=1123755 RepID=A0A1I6N0D7_9RHOB|nr:hypothetical protein [Yoonia litorea]SFS21409.1 hypothetical protein SAMN05444714_2822 [Yoonia litorea]